MHPNIAFSIAIGIPKKIIQMMLANRDGTPPPYSISFPKGAKARLANLKHCSPTGIPTMVTHHSSPTSVQPSPIQSPPNKNHTRLPKNFIEHSPHIFIGWWFKIAFHLYNGEGEGNISPKIQTCCKKFGKKCRPACAIIKKKSI